MKFFKQRCILFTKLVLVSLIFFCVLLYSIINYFIYQRIVVVKLPPYWMKSVLKLECSAKWVFPGRQWGLSNQTSAALCTGSLPPSSAPRLRQSTNFESSLRRDVLLSLLSICTLQSDMFDRKYTALNNNKIVAIQCS